MLFTLYSPFFIYTTIMKIVTLAGLIILVITFLAVGELNGSLTTQQELVSESLVELENSESAFDCDTTLHSHEMRLHTVESKNIYGYKNDLILFDLSKDLFRPPSLT